MCLFSRTNYALAWTCSPGSAIFPHYSVESLSMETVVKKYLKHFPFKITAVVLLICLNASAETVTDSEAGADVSSDSEGGAVSETLTVTVTRTGEGIEVVTPDGRHVLLKDDHTWEYLEREQLPPEESAVLGVANVKELSNACDIGFRLTNNLPYKIKSLVPSFSAYTRDQILFDTQSKSFNSIKPTRSQYHKVRFIGITCPEISHIKLFGADRCTMGPFTKFDSDEGECLKRVHIQESDLIEVLK
jgi:endonuclease YncB( thermonuclease family)